MVNSQHRTPNERYIVKELLRDRVVWYNDYLQDLIFFHKQNHV